MSITGSLVGYENNNEINSKKNRSLLNITGSSSSKQCGSLNSSISNSVITTSSVCTANLKNQNKSIERKCQTKSRLHLNSLWSIWYGILMTLVQGYLAIQGAHRFLVCSLLQWKMDTPSIELNIQIIFCGLVFLLLPLFLTSALLKVGNLANDGVKLATGNGKCSAQPHDGLEEEAKGGTMRALWTHGGPTSAFLHVTIALSLLVPRLLLEARMIENGLLPKEYIWRTELDFMVTHRDRLVVLSFMTSPYQNTSESSINQAVEGVTNGSTIPTDTYTMRPIHLFEKTHLIEKFNSDDDDFFDTHENLEVEPPPPTLSSSSSSASPSMMITEPTINYTKYENSGTYRKSGDKSRNTNKGGGAGGGTGHNKNNTKKHSHRNEHGNGREQKESDSSRRHKNNNKKDSDDVDVDLELKPEKNVAFEKINNFEGPPLFEVNRNGKKQLQPMLKQQSTKQPPIIIGDKESDSVGTKKTIKDSHIHIVRPEKMPDTAIPSTPLSLANSKIIEIKPSTKNNGTSSKKVKRFSENISFNSDDMDTPRTGGVLIEPAALIGAVPVNITTIAEQTGLVGILQKLFGIEQQSDPKKWASLPSLEFLNLAIAIMVWSVRYPAVFWGTSKPFAIVFSIQMVANGLSILLDYIGCSVLYKLEVIGHPLPMRAPTLLLNATVTVSLFILSTVLIMSSSLVLYLYGHGKLSTRIRERKIISTKTGDTWTYFAHCASLCFVLALSVVKAPLMHDLSAAYKGSLDGSVLASALSAVVHLFLWIVLWLGLTAKRRWSFKLPPLETVRTSAAEPLLVSQRLHGGNNSGGQHCIHGHHGHGGSASGAGIGGSGIGNGEETIYWPKLTPNSPKLKVTFNEVPSTSSQQDLGEHDGKRYKARGASVCMSAIAGEADDGDYATLRGPTGDLLHLSDLGGICDMTDDNTSEEGKLLACVRDDSVTYASTRDLEPPIDPCLMNSDNYVTADQLVSPLAPVTVTVHTNEAHITSSSTPRCLRRADSGVPNEALTPRSDTTSTESSTSPPDRAPSETSSGVHSGEERDEVVIRPRPGPYKTIAKPVQPAIAEEPFGRSTNMKMSSFNNEGKSSATLPLTRGIVESTLPQYPQCSTMPLPIGCHQQQQVRQQSYTPNSQSKTQLHTTLPNGLRYTSHFLRRIPYVTNAESPYGILGLGSGHHTFSKLLHDPLSIMPIPEDRDSANYSIISEQEIFISTGHIN